MKPCKSFMNIARLLALAAVLAVLPPGAAQAQNKAQAQDKELAKKIDALLSSEFLDKLPLILAWRTSEIALKQYARNYEEARRIADERNDQRSQYILEQADDFLLSQVSRELSEFYTYEYAQIIGGIYKKLLENDPGLGQRKRQVLELIDQRITLIIAAAGRYLDQAQAKQ